MNKKFKLIFALIDAVLVGVVAAIVALTAGLGCTNNIIAYVVLLATLLLPIPLAFFNKSLGLTIGTVLLIVSLVASSAFFLAKGPAIETKWLGITYLIIVSVYLVFALVFVIAKAKDQKEQE